MTGSVAARGSAGSVLGSVGAETSSRFGLAAGVGAAMASASSFGSAPRATFAPANATAIAIRAIPRMSFFFAEHVILVPGVWFTAWRQFQNAWKPPYFDLVGIPEYAKPHRDGGHNF